MSSLESIVTHAPTTAGMGLIAGYWPHVFQVCVPRRGPVPIMGPVNGEVVSSRSIMLVSDRDFLVGRCRCGVLDWLSNKMTGA